MLRRLFVLAPFVPVKRDRASAEITLPLFVVGAYHRSLIYVQVFNPATGANENVSARVDTGADNVIVSAFLAARLGLTPSAEAPQRFDMGSASAMFRSTEIEYRLADAARVMIPEFSPQRTKCYVNEGDEFKTKNASYHMALGERGFLDRFEEVTLSYPRHEMRFVWRRTATK